MKSLPITYSVPLTNYCLIIPGALVLNAISILFFQENTNTDSNRDIPGTTPSFWIQLLNPIYTLRALTQSLHALPSTLNPFSSPSSSPTHTTTSARHTHHVPAIKQRPSQARTLKQAGAPTKLPPIKKNVPPLVIFTSLYLSSNSYTLCATLAFKRKQKGLQTELRQKKLACLRKLAQLPA